MEKFGGPAGRLRFFRLPVPSAFVLFFQTADDIYISKTFGGDRTGSLRGGREKVPLSGLTTDRLIFNIFPMQREEDGKFMRLALEEARRGVDEGGLPIGAVLVRNGEIVAQGHNRRVQEGDPIAHGEMDCLRRAGRQGSYRDTVLYTTLSPCMMCSGTIAQFKIPRVVIGENVNFGGNEAFLESRGVEVVLLNDEDCIDLMGTFIKDNADLWNEDIDA